MKHLVEPWYLPDLVGHAPRIRGWVGIGAGHDAPRGVERVLQIDLVDAPLDLHLLQ